MLGGENIFSNIEDGFPNVSWEDIIDKNPDVIIIHKWNADDNPQSKIDYLKSKPELSEVNAIKNDMFIVVSLLSVFPSIQNTQVLQAIAEGLHPDCF